MKRLPGPALALCLLLVCLGSPGLLGATRAPRSDLAVVEALLEDLHFRGLLLYDREVLQRAHAPENAPANARPSAPARLVARPKDARPGRPSPPADALGRPAPVALVSGPATDLASFVAILARRSPGPIVTGRFSDWRNPSVYRLAAGLHHGYDIAYPARTPIAAGWPGRVTSVLNWYGAEYGITVLSGGFQVTYGHLSPSVRTGDVVRPGDVVGTVVNDHVDVKMRDLAGGFVDFARGVPGLAVGALAQTSPGATPGSLVLALGPAHGRTPASLPPPPGPAWTRDRAAVAAAVAYLKCRHDEFTLLERQRSEDAPDSARLAQELVVVRQRLESARRRLVEARVPEAVLLAALVESPEFRDARFATGEPGSAEVDPVDDRPRLLAVVGEAEQAVDDLRALLRQLDAPAR